MRILQVIPALGAGGAEQAVIDINEALIKAGHKSYVVSSGGDRVAAVEAAGGIHITMPAASKNPLQIWANAKKLKAIIRQEGITVIHARSRAPAWSAWLAARWCKLPFVTTFHAAYSYGNVLKQRYNSVMTRGARVIAISDFIAQHVREAYGVPPERIVTIYRGIDLTHFDRAAVTPERRETLRTLWKVAPNRPIILLPARLTRIKGQDVLIAAMCHLMAQEQAGDSVVVLIGADQGRKHYVRELLEQAVSGRLSDRVVIADHCDDMPAAYALASLVVVPSLVPEGFGRVPVEAQAMGVPVIASDLGATRETVLPDVTGWLVPPDDPIVLAEKIHAVMQLPPEVRMRLGQQAAARAHEKYALPMMTAATLAVYHDVSKAAEKAES
ncbi:MAG: glycosyltransferase family 4 protein [Alphaproteobacteria bacterium]|nr:glycosyltransferase family 4 protein [Alphaproteobacteria bacterium]